MNDGMTQRTLLLGSAMATAILVSTTPALGGSLGGFWPQFHGPKRNNRSTETGLLKQWPKDGPRLAWKFAECGRGYAGVSVAEGRVFTSGDVDGEEFVLALDLEGRLLWKTANGKNWRGSTPGSRANPTWSDGAVYHLNPHGRLAALEAKSGKEIWAVDLQKEYGARRGAWGLCENVLVEGDKVLCVPGSDRASVVALDKKTGKLVWANAEIDDDGAYCTPVIATYGGKRRLITLMRMSVVSIDVATGKLLWSHTHPSRYSQNVTSPLFTKGHLFVSSGHQAGGRMLKVDAEGTSVRELWYSGEFDNCHGGLMQLGDHLYGSGCRLYHKGLLCVEFATGKTVYRAKEMGKVSITYADGRLYCIDQKGKVSLVDASPREARVVSHFTIPWEHKDQSLAHPVVCGGRLYLRHAQNLFVYDVRGSAR